MNPAYITPVGIVIKPGYVFWGPADELGIKAGYCSTSNGIPQGQPLFKLSCNSDDGYVLTSPWKNTRENHLTEFDANLSAHRLVQKWCQEIAENSSRRERLSSHYQVEESVHVASILVSFLVGGRAHNPRLRAILIPSPTRLTSLRPMSYLTEHDNERLSAQFGRWQAKMVTGTTDEILAARAAMGAALFVLRMHYADEQLFLSIAEDPLGLQPYEVADLMSAAVGDDDENTNTIPALINV